MNIYASQPYENEGHYYDYFQLKFYCDRHVWFFIRSSNDKPKGYLLSEDRELINEGDLRYYINFDTADLEGEYIGDICIDTV